MISKWFDIDASVQEKPYRDRRVKSTLDIKDHYILSRLFECSNKFKILKDSKLKLISSLSEIVPIIKSFSSLNENLLNPFNYLFNWNKLSLEDKNYFYSRTICNEINYFIYKKDKEYFANVVRPFIENKINKTFLDKYMLDMEINVYFSDIIYYSKLNTFEKCLLISRSPLAIRQKIFDHLNDTVKANPISSNTMDTLFEIIMNVFFYLN